MAQARQSGSNPASPSAPEPARGTVPARPRPLAKVIAAAVVLGAFAVFAAVIWYAWRESSMLVAGEPPLVKAPEGPWKVRPEEPGGAPIVNESAPIARVLEGRREEEPVRLLQPELPTPRVLERLQAQRRETEGAAVPEPAAGAATSGPATSGEAGTHVAALPPPGGTEEQGAAAPAEAHGGQAGADEAVPAAETAPDSGAMPQPAGENAAARLPADGSAAPAHPGGGEEEISAATHASAEAEAGAGHDTGPAATALAARQPASAPTHGGSAEPQAAEPSAHTSAPASESTDDEAAKVAARPAPVETAAEPAPAPAAERTGASAGAERGEEAAAPVRTAARMPASATVPAGPIWRVQLGAYSRERTALSAFERAKRRFADLIGDSEPVLVPIEVKGRTLHRLQFGAFASRAEAERVCAEIRSRGGECLVARAGG